MKVLQIPNQNKQHRGDRQIKGEKVSAYTLPHRKGFLKLEAGLFTLFLCVDCGLWMQSD